MLLKLVLPIFFFFCSKLTTKELEHFKTFLSSEGDWNCMLQLCSLTFDRSGKDPSESEKIESVKVCHFIVRSAAFLEPIAKGMQFFLYFSVILP